MGPYLLFPKKDLKRVVGLVTSQNGNNRVPGHPEEPLGIPSLAVLQGDAAALTDPNHSAHKKLSFWIRRVPRHPQGFEQGPWGFPRDVLEIFQGFRIS